MSSRNPFADAAACSVGAALDLDPGLFVVGAPAFAADEAKAVAANARMVV